MRAAVTRAALSTVVLALTLHAGVASAQESITNAGKELGTENVPDGIGRALSRANITPVAAPASQRDDRGMLIGALAGAAAATSVTYWAANLYGNNEGGEFCSACFWTWGAVSIPAGAIVGSLVGKLIGSAASPQSAPRVSHTFVTPVIGRRGGGVVVSVRY